MDKMDKFDIENTELSYKFNTLKRTGEYTDIIKEGLSQIAISLLICTGYVIISPLLSELYIWDAYKIFYLLHHYGVPVLMFLIPAIFLIYIVKKKGKVNWVTVIPPTVLWLVIYGINLINRTDNSRLLSIAPRSLVMLFLIAMLCGDPRNVGRVMAALTHFYILLALVNAILKIWPQLYDIIGPWRTEAFIASDNASTFPLMFGMMFAMLDNYYNHNSCRLYVYALVFLANQVVLRCATAIVGAGMIFFYFIPVFRKKMGELSVWSILGSQMLLFTGLMFGLDKITKCQLIQYIVVKLLHKDLTLSARSYVWRDILSMVYESPFWGHGLAPHADIIYEATLASEEHAHNLLLQCLYEGGLIFFFATIAMLSITGKQIKKVRDDALCPILKITLLIFLTMQQTDFPAYWSVYTTMIVCGLICTCPELGIDNKKEI